MTRIDVVIPTRNGSDLLTRCLRALALSSISDFHVIVFDDASTESIAEVVGREWPGASIVRSERNVGLARGCNQAIERGSGEYVVLLNNDTEVEPGWLAELVACAERHPKAGSVASKLRLLSDRRRLHSAGDTYSVVGMPGNRGVWLEDFGQYDLEEPIFGACGGAALYRRVALDDVRRRDGFVFDERLFMYCEDVDLAWRLQLAGWNCVFAPRAVVYHALSATGGGPLASYFVSRNLWLVMARSVPRGMLAPPRRIAAYHLGRARRDARHVREAAARASMRGTLAGIAMAASARRRPRTSPGQARRVRGLLSGADR